MRYTVVFSPEVEAQIAELYRYIAEAASPDVAFRYTSAVVRYCESLRTFPQRGIARDDIRVGLRITSYQKRVAIAFHVEANRIVILGVFYGGQDYETTLREEKDDTEY